MLGKILLQSRFSSLQMGLTCVWGTDGTEEGFLVTQAVWPLCGKEGRRVSGAPTDRESEQRPACAYSLASSYRHGRILPDLARTD